MGAKLGTDENVGLESGDSREQVRRYIRLTEFISSLLDMVDAGKIAMRPAVEISYLSKRQQNVLFDIIGYEDRTPPYAQAAMMRKLSNEGALTDETIHSIMREEKINRPKHLKIPSKRINRFFPEGTSAQAIEDTIIRALELWYKKKKA